MTRQTNAARFSKAIGDLDGDINALFDEINRVPGQRLPTYATDINRNGLTKRADIFAINRPAERRRRVRSLDRAELATLSVGR